MTTQNQVYEPKDRAKIEETYANLIEERETGKYSRQNYFFRAVSATCGTIIGAVSGFGLERCVPDMIHYGKIFWETSEYLQTPNNFNWGTLITTIALAGVGFLVGNTIGRKKDFEKMKEKNQETINYFAKEVAPGFDEDNKLSRENGLVARLPVIEQEIILNLKRQGQRERLEASL